MTASRTSPSAGSAVRTLRLAWLLAMRHRERRPRRSTATRLSPHWAARTVTALPLWRDLFRLATWANTEAVRVERQQSIPKRWDGVPPSAQRG